MPVSCVFCNTAYADRKDMLWHIRYCEEGGSRLTEQQKLLHKVHQCSKCYLCWGSKASLTSHRKGCQENEDDVEAVNEDANIDITNRVTGPDISTDDLHKLFLVGGKPTCNAPKRILNEAVAAASKLVEHLLGCLQLEDNENERFATLAFCMFPSIIGCTSSLPKLRGAFAAISESDDPAIATIQQLQSLGFLDQLRETHKKRLSKKVALSQIEGPPALCQPETTEQERLQDAARRARRQIYSGNLAKAVKTLEQVHNGEAPIAANAITDDVIEALALLHPEAEALNRPSFGSSHEPFSSVEILAALSTAKRGASIARSPWTSELMLAFCQLDNNTFTSKLGKLLDIMAIGKLRNRDIWCVSRLVPIEKADGGIRPIALGDTTIRLFGRMVTTRYTPVALKQFGVIQLGYGIADGVAVAAHSLQSVANRVLQDNSDMILVGDDKHNAFNSISRKVIDDKLQETLPQLVDFFRWSYGESSDLIDNEGNVICQSSCGVKQGDPIGSFCFDLATIDGLQHLQDKYRTLGVRVIAIHDDVYFFGPHPATISAFAEYDTISKEYGLERNTKKTVMLRGEHLGPSVDHLLPGTRITSNGFKAIGVPIGSDDFIIDTSNKIFDEYGKILGIVGDLPPELALPILSTCINARPNHFLRCVDPTLVSYTTGTWDSSLDGVLAKLCRMSGGSLDSYAQTARGLPAKKGGLGIRRLEFLRHDAHFASFSNFAQFWTENDPTFLEQWDIDGTIDIKSHRLRSNVYISENVVEELPVIAPKQKDLSRERDEHTSTTLLSDESISKHRRAWLLSSSIPGCSTWMFSALQGPHLRLSSQQYTEALRLRLGCPIIEGNRWWCECGYIHNEQRDGFQHGHVCRVANGHRTHCHDNVVRGLFDFLVKVQPDGHWQMEQTVGPGARADIIGTVDHKLYIIDCAITAPNTVYALLQRSDSYPLTAARIREEQKLQHYENARRALIEQVPTVVPFVLETTGAIGKRAAEFIDTVCKLPRVLAIADSDLAIHRRNFKKLLNVCVVRGLAESLRAARRAAVIDPELFNNIYDVLDNNSIPADNIGIFVATT